MSERELHTLEVTVEIDPKDEGQVHRCQEALDKVEMYARGLGLPHIHRDRSTSNG